MVRSRFSDSVVPSVIKVSVPRVLPSTGGTVSGDYYLPLTTRGTDRLIWQVSLTPASGYSHAVLVIDLVAELARARFQLVATDGSVAWLGDVCSGTCTVSFGDGMIRTRRVVS